MRLRLFLWLRYLFKLFVKVLALSRDFSVTFVQLFLDLLFYRNCEFVCDLVVFFCGLDFFLLGGSHAKFLLKEPVSYTAHDPEHQNDDPRANYHSHRLKFSICALLCINGLFDAFTTRLVIHRVAGVAQLFLHAKTVMGRVARYTLVGDGVKELVELAGGHKVQVPLRAELKSKVHHSLSERNRVVRIVLVCLELHDVKVIASFKVDLAPGVHLHFDQPNRHVVRVEKLHHVL